MLSSFGLAEALKNQGHEVMYVSIADNEEFVRKQGFGFYPMFGDIYPLGFRAKFKKERSTVAYNRQKEKLHMEKIIDGSFDAFFREVNPDMLIVSSFLVFESLLLHYKYKVQPVIYTPMLRYHEASLLTECMDMIMTLPSQMVTRVMGFLDGLSVKFNSLDQLIKPIQSFTELVCCPAEFEIKPNFSGTKYYIEPSMRSGDSLGSEHYLGKVKEGKKIIYASLGSQTIRYGAITHVFFKKMMDMMRDPRMQHLDMILCVGPELGDESIPPPQERVTTVRWISQIDLLQHASLVINHGGLGTVKECIYYGVPMVAFGIRHDQPHNASLIEYHKLGIIINIEEITIDDLVNKVLAVLEDEEIRANLDKMKRLFEQSEIERPGVRVIERILKERQAAPVPV